MTNRLGFGAALP